jgi:hypothetical protein
VNDTEFRLELLERLKFARRLARGAQRQELIARFRLEDAKAELCFLHDMVRYQQQSEALLRASQPDSAKAQKGSNE